MSGGGSMPGFTPFRGVHYDSRRFGTDLSRLAAPPYDVIDEDRLAHLRSVDEHNAVHLTLPEGGDRGEADDRYVRAGERWRSWLSEGVLVARGEPCLYLYRVAFEDEDGRPRQMTGVIGALGLSPPGEGGVLPHERTMSKPKGDRLDLIRATRANLEPIWGLSLTAGLSGLLEPDGAPLMECTDTRGARHRLYALTAGDRIEAVAGAIASSPVVIADGHHRYETSLHYQEECRAAGDGPGSHDRIMTMIVELADDQLAVRPIHRLVTGLPGPSVLRETLADAFDLVPAGANEPGVIEALGGRMASEGAMALVEPDAVTLLRPRTNGGEVGVIDAVRFESAVAPTLADLGAEVSYRHDRVVVAEQVRKGAADAAVLLAPVPVPTIRAVAERGERMPQKTTFFHPKPSTGLVFRSLDEG